MKPSVDSLASLVRFLITRIDEDEAELRRLKRASLRSDVSEGTSAGDDGGVRSIARQRVECQTKRQVIAQSQLLLVLRDLPNEREVREAAAQILRVLAEPYSEHRGYRREWAGKPATVGRRLAGGTARRPA